MITYRTSLLREYEPNQLECGNSKNTHLLGCEVFLIAKHSSDHIYVV